MIVIPALTEDGRNALADLEGASPGGGFVTSRPAARTELVPGHIVRHHGAWMAVTDIRHNGIHGLTRASLVDASGCLTTCVLVGSQAAVIRTDTRIDPGTLHKIFPHHGAPEARDDGDQVRVAFAWQQTITYHSVLTFARAAIRAAGHDPDDQAGVLAWLQAGARGMNWAGRVDIDQDWTGVMTRQVNSATILPGPPGADAPDPRRPG